MQCYQQTKIDVCTTSITSADALPTSRLDAIRTPVFYSIGSNPATASISAMIGFHPARCEIRRPGAHFFLYCPRHDGRIWTPSYASLRSRRVFTACAQPAFLSSPSPDGFFAGAFGKGV